MKFILYMLFIVSVSAFAEHDSGGEMDAPAPLPRRDSPPLRQWSCEIKGFCANDARVWEVGTYCASSDPRDAFDSMYSGERLCRDLGVRSRESQCVPTKYKCEQPGPVFRNGQVPDGVL